MCRRYGPAAVRPGLQAKGKQARLGVRPRAPDDLSRPLGVVNQSTLATQQATIARKLETIRAIQKAIRLGPFNAEHASALATARQEWEAARTAYEQSPAGLKTRMGPRLSQTQQANWTAIQNGWGQTLPLRMLALTNQQRHDYARARRLHDLQMANARRFCVLGMVATPARKLRAFAGSKPH